MKGVKDYLDAVKDCAEQLKDQNQEINRVIDLLREAKENGKQVFICGNGGSAGTATHMAGDFFKISGLKANSLDDNVPLMTALINDEGWGSLYDYQLKRLFNPGDILIAISVHGGSGQDKAGAWSQNLLKAIDYVNKHDGHTIGFSGFDGGAMKQLCDVCVVVPVESTPLVESFHVVLHHLIAFALHEEDRI
ncbi:phosphoheptose isomerase [Thermoplasmatales archaeon SCGC AB-539-N05]|nr:phosphoheptose isomerase [Thermoplasmatales archaeon SCGC AB-539-N05]